MRRSLFIILTLFLLPFYAAAYPLFFPFDSLNTPDETLPCAPGGFYVAGAFYYLNDTGEYYDDAGKTRDYLEQDWWYAFIPFNFGYRFRFGLEAGAQVTAVSNDTDAGSTGGLGDFWFKARYVYPLNERFYIGGRLAGKFFDLHEYSIPAVSDRTNSFDITFFGGADIAGPVIAKYAVGYRLVGNMNDLGGPFYTGDIGNDFRVTAAPGLSLAGGAYNITVPISYLSTSVTAPAYPNEGYVTIEYYGLSAGFKTTYSFGENIHSMITMSAEFPLKGRNVSRDYFIGGGYSAVVPF
jgi:hypothetical protein